MGVCNTTKKKDNHHYEEEDDINSNKLRKTTTLKETIEKLFPKGAYHFNKKEE